MLVELPVRSAPVIPGAAAAPASVGTSSEPRANRASRSTANDKISGQHALILYILFEAGRFSPMF
jgi:hypothetical protein